MRPGPTFGQWRSIELSAERMNAIFIPEGFAHGFLALEPHTTLLYQMSPAFLVGHGMGIRWNDPDIAIDWPAQPHIISRADDRLPFLRDLF